MKKAILFLVTAVLLLATALCLFVVTSAEEVVYSDTLGNLTWSLNAATGELVISGEGEMQSLADTPAWLAYGDLIQTVTIRDGVTSIGNHAFKNCKNLSAVTIPSSVTSIGYLSFWYCNRLTEITIPSTCTFVSDRAFSQCENIARITMPSAALPALPQFGVKHMILTDGTSIPGSAFMDQSGLISITLPDTITAIGDFAFYNCINLTSIVLPHGVKTIGSDAFYNCRSLESINIPDTVQSFGSSAFARCESLTSITIPKSATSIEANTFRACKSLTSIVIPDSVEFIGNSAFQGCNKLVEVILPNKLDTIGNFAFASCEGLKKIVIPNGIRTISGYAFDGTKNIETASLPIAAMSFIPKTSLKTVIFTSGATISENVFATCTTLQRVVFCGTKAEWESLQKNQKWMEGFKDVTFSYHDCQWEATDGSHRGSCSLCGEVIDGEHIWDNGTIVTPSTHLESGSKAYVCTVCKKRRTEELEKLAAHQYGDWEVVSPATEESEGKQQKRCVCGSIISESIPALTHEYLATVVEPTCTEQGYTTYTCKNCGDAYKDAFVNAKGHTYDNDGDATCNVCNALREIESEQATMQTEEASKAEQDTFGKEEPHTGCGATLAKEFWIMPILLVGMGIGLSRKKKAY